MLFNCVACWSLCTVTLCTLVECISDIDGSHMSTYTLIITGWMDCIDVGFTERAGGLCEDAIG